MYFNGCISLNKRSCGKFQLQMMFLYLLFSEQLEMMCVLDQRQVTTNCKQRDIIQLNTDGLSLVIVSLYIDNWHVLVRLYKL